MVVWGIIQRMILIDLIKIFVIALIALTGLILLAGVISEAMKSGLGPVQILCAIPLMLPGMLPYTVPTTTLFTTCIVYGRLSTDNEILALRAAGVHIGHVILPAMLLGIATSVITMMLYLDAIPYTQYLLKVSFVGDVEELLYTMLRNDGCIQHPKLSFEMHVNRMNGKKLFDVEFRRRKADGDGFDIVARAVEAEMRVDQKNMKILIDMRQCQIVQPGKEEAPGGVVVSRIWDFAIPDLNGPSVKNRPMEMTWSELLDARQRLHEEKQNIGRDIDLHMLGKGPGELDPVVQRHLDSQFAERRLRDNQLFAIENEFHMRVAIAIGCICFALVGCPVGIWFSKSDYLSAFITCFVPIVTVYYPLLLCTINLGKSGRIPPWLGVYDADALMLIAAALLFRLLARN